MQNIYFPFKLISNCLCKYENVKSLFFYFIVFLLKKKVLEAKVTKWTQSPP